MKKHAFCILAHNKWKQLQRLIKLLDDDRNDIYLHVDAKSLESYQQYGGVKTKHSKLYLVENPIDVEWSDVSLCDAEVKLFKKVIESGFIYQYTHLLSGSDLPVVNQDKIHTFFDNRTEEFIDFQCHPSFERRIRYYHFFVRGRRNSRFKDFVRRLLMIPQLLFVDRLKGAPLKFAYGHEWCSLTQNAVREIVDKYGHYRYMFEKTVAGDEHYKQMILIASERTLQFAKEGCLRYVRFEGKASPKIVTMNDYDEIMSSGCVLLVSLRRERRRMRRCFSMRSPSIIDILLLRWSKR